MNKKILIVVMMIICAMPCRQLLSEWGIDVVTAENGKEALDIALKEPFDLIISDIRMPVMDGETFFRILRSSGITTNICFVTAYGTVDSAVN